MRVLMTLSAVIMTGVSFFCSADSSVTIGGNVVATPCMIDTGTVNKQVAFSSLHRMELVNAGAGGEWQDFSLDINNCPTGTRQVTVKYLGTQDSHDGTAWKNSGSATGVALRLTNAAHSVIYSQGDTQSLAVNASTHGATFPMSAKIFTPQGNAGPGTFSTVINLEFTWQ